MNSALCLATFLATVCLSLAATPEYKAKVVASIAVCASENKIDKKEIIELMKSNKLPETKEQKCVAGCFLEKMDYVTDMSLDWDKLKAQSSQKYDTPELVEKADQIADICSKVITEKFSDICDLGVPVMKCLLEESEKVKLPKPDFKFEE